MNHTLLILSSFGYLAILFAIAYFAEKKTATGTSFLRNPYIYSLSLAVYCTAWTYYGSVGRAASNGLEFLTVYIGPTMFTPLWWIVLRKIIRICKIQRISTIADFISSRYGKNIALGGFVTLLSVLALIPYISIQIKAISNSFDILWYGTTNLSSILPTHAVQVWKDTALYITILLAIFSIFFGTREVEATERHEGLVTAIAFESIVKLLAFFAVGIFVCYFVFTDVSSILIQAAKIPELAKHFTIQEPNETRSWFWLCLVSGLAVICLPRQFQVSVVENTNEKHLNKAIWIFPLYLFLINLFVLPIALGGQIMFEKGVVDADTFVLAFPLSKGYNILALITYIGGLSAATSMIIVETIALSTMISNNLILPVLAGPELHETFRSGLNRFPIYLRRASIIAILLFAYLYFKSVSYGYSLVSVGLTSFVGVAQFAPAMIGGIFWKRGTKDGALAGLLSGAFIWFYTLIIPSMVGAKILPESIISQGLFDLAWLNPYSLFGLTGFDPISHGMFWSICVNTGLYIIVSLNTTQTTSEHNQAEIFVDIFKYSTAFESTVAWKGTAYIPDIRSLLENFLGRERATEAMSHFEQNHENQQNDSKIADAKLVNYAEKMLAGAIGTASARIMVSSVVKEEEIRIDDVVDILKETQQVLELNKKLEQKSLELEELTEKLQETNEKLRKLDELKDDFLSTVTHELRTPMTSIRALSEILYDNPDMEMDGRQTFLNTVVKETERISRLISQVLDLEKFEAGKVQLQGNILNIKELMREAIVALRGVTQEKNIHISVEIKDAGFDVWGDRDMLFQVLMNVLSNAIKFTRDQILIELKKDNGLIFIVIEDNGKGISKELHQAIFDKFYQVKNKNINKPQGSGLGLAITQKIVALHEGEIWIENKTNGEGARFVISLPINHKKHE